MGGLEALVLDREPRRRGELVDELGVVEQPPPVDDGEHVIAGRADQGDRPLPAHGQLDGAAGLVHPPAADGVQQHQLGVAQRAASCTWGYGTYGVDGDETTWRFTDGGGQAPNDAQNKPGEEFVYRLSVYRDTVTLAPVKGAISAANFIAKPWRRIGSPSPDRLNRRCPPPAAALAR
jgi:hypothetical protein